MIQPLGFSFNMISRLVHEATFTAASSKVNPAEHAGYGWFTFDKAAEKVASWTNRKVVLKLKPKG